MAAAAEVKALGPDRIFEQALALIDAHGLAAFNIRTLAGALGVAPAAIYWHVPSRDALVSGAIALALNGVGDSMPQSPWQQTLRTLMHRFRDALRQHPGLAPVVASELAYNADFDAPLLDKVVAALRAARFEGGALVDAFNVVIAAMCGFATLELAAAPAEATEAWRAACSARIDAIDPQKQPHLFGEREVLRNRAFLMRWSDGIERPLDSGFAAWVDVVVNGLASRSRALRRSRDGA
jgi:AcrR family transcriptional regulator